MLITMRQITLALFAAGATLVLSSQPAQAGPFLDWLFGRPILVYPSPVVPVAAPSPVAVVPSAVFPAVGVVPANEAPVLAAPVAQVTNYAPAVGYATAPVAVAQPAVVAPPSAYALQPAQPVVVGYAPTFRTSWQQVPVTYYRPVVTNYVSGYPTVAGQPCNGYAWQAQRVPTLVRRPWLPFSGYTYVAPVPVAPVATVNYAPAPTTVTYAPAAPAVPACSCPTGVAAPVVAPLTVAPSNGAPLPGYTSPAAGVVSGSSSPSPATGYSATPADQAPNLLQNHYPALPANNSPPLPPAPLPDNTVTPQAAVPADAASSRKDAISPYRVAPIPAPDLQKFGPTREAPQAPPLLNGRERTVSNSVGQAMTVEQASWVTSEPASRSSAAVVKPAAPKALWNDSGWQSSKSR